MKLVFQENPKFGDEQDVTQQIIAIDEHIEKLLAEIKRFEVRPRVKVDHVILSRFSVVHRRDRTNTNTSIFRLRFDLAITNELWVRSID